MSENEFDVHRGNDKDARDNVVLTGEEIELPGDGSDAAAIIGEASEPINTGEIESVAIGGLTGRVPGAAPLKPTIEDKISTGELPVVSAPSVPSDEADFASASEVEPVDASFEAPQADAGSEHEADAEPVAEEPSEVEAPAVEESAVEAAAEESAVAEPSQVDVPTAKARVIEEPPQVDVPTAKAHVIAEPADEAPVAEEEFSSSEPVRSPIMTPAQAAAALGLNLDSAREDRVEPQAAAPVAAEEPAPIEDAPEHPAEASVKLAGDLDQVRRQIKDAIRAKTAVRSVTGFTFNNSQKEGTKFVRDLTKLLLRAYNAEAENCVKTARAGNYHVAQNRLEKAREQIRKAGAMIGLDVAESFHRLRLREIELATLHLQAVAAAKEKERARREEAREAARALKELEAAKAKQQKTVDHHLNVLAKLQETGDTEGMDRVREQLAEAQAALADVDNRLANTRAGYVYVISNLGSFGERMVKIGMTRRLDPMDRVKELGDASVPFNFDVHALFFSQDAVDVETMLHQHFAHQRVNRVNLRREYFYATPDDVRTALAAHDVEVVEFRTEADAEEFNLSEEIRATEHTHALAPTGR